MSAYSALRILIVDDDPMMTTLLTRVLTKLGAPVGGTATDGQAGLDAIDAAPYDLVFCDIDMPGMDGIEFLRHLRGRPIRPAVAVLSSTPDAVRESVEKLGLAHQLKIVGSLPKPASQEALKAILDRFMTQPMPSVPMQAGYFTLSQADVLSLLPGGIEVDYQPLHDPMTGEIRAMEALARMRHPTYGLIGPAIFVPICERAGAATLLLRAVLAASSTFLAKLHAAGHDDLKIAINVSSADLTTPDLVGEISGVVEKAGIHPSSVILELTESRALDETTLPTEILTRLRVRGFGLAVDDFGTGYASLKQLGAIPFTELKIDQTFVRGAYNDEKKRLMLRSTLDLARELSLLTVAEGVETEADLELVRSMGVDLIQGFHLSKPMRPEKLLELLG